MFTGYIRVSIGLVVAKAASGRDPLAGSDGCWWRSLNKRPGSLLPAWCQRTTKWMAMERCHRVLVGFLERGYGCQRATSEAFALDTH